MEFDKSKTIGCFSIKAIATMLGKSKDLIKNILKYLNATPEYSYGNRNWYSQKTLDDVKNFLEENPNTKSFFVKLYANSIDKEEKNKQREKAKQTMLERYGYENPSKSKDVQDKKKENFLNKHGMNFSEYMKSNYNEETRKKYVKTIMEKYGENAFRDFAKKASESINYEEAHRKSKATNLMRYNVENPGQCKEFLEKRNITRIENRNKNVSYIENTLEGKPLYLIREELDTYDFAIRRSIDFNKVELLHYNNIPYIKKCDFDIIKTEILRIQNAGTPSSGLEEELAEYIKTLYSGKIIFNDREVIAPKELDIYIPDLNVAIEFNGIYFHSSMSGTPKEYHFEKSRRCEEKGIRLIHIYEDEWRDLIKREKVKMMLEIVFNSVRRKIYARKCTVKKITDAEAKILNDKVHLQNHRKAEVTYGLFYNEELVQLMSFSRNKYNRNLKTKNSWEIIRGCPGSNNIVVGGVSKLFNAFVKDYKPDYIFSYCDFNKFDGKSYTALGMKFVGYTGPDLKWVFKDKNAYSGLKLVERDPNKHKEYSENSVGKLYGAGSKKYEISFDSTEENFK